MKNIVYLNGKYLPADSATVSITDRGFLYGDGIFESMRAYNGTVFALQEHLDRLKRSARVIGLKLPAASGLAAAVNGTLKRNGFKDAYLRLTVTRGSGGKRLAPEAGAHPTVLVTAQTFPGYPDGQYRKGWSLMTLKVRRNAGSPVSRIKSLNYLDNIIGKLELKKGYDEGMFLNDKGNIACGTICNIFFIRKGVLYTPPKTAGILPGITRKIILEKIAPAAGLRVREKNIRPADLNGFLEAFVTNSLMEIMPVRKIGKKHFRERQVTEQLQEKLKGYIRKRCGA